MCSESNDNTEIALIDSVTSEKLTEISLDLAEVAFDSTLNEGLLKDIPYFGTLYKLIQAGIGIKDYFFAKKVYRFLFEIKDIPSDERTKFIYELQKIEGTSQRAGETLVILLERLDHLDKPKIIGRLFRAKIENRISMEDFLRLAFIVDRCFIHDLNYLKNYGQSNSKEHISEMLAGLGLLTLLKEGQAWFDNKDGKTKKTLSYYMITTIGEMLIRYGM